MKEMLQGRRVLITGGARGLGLAFAVSVAEQGAKVVIADVLLELAQIEAEKLRTRGLDVHALTLDVSSPESISNCAKNAIHHLGGLDGLVNNAAVTNSGGINSEDISVDMWNQVMNVNVRGTWLMINACSKALRDSGQGSIVNLASDTPLWGAPRLMAYVASKGAIIAMTKSLAREFGSDNVTVNALAPGLTLVEATAYVPQDRHDFYLNGRAIKREQLPEDVCGAVVFCLSDLSRFVTGELIAVNGGFVMH